MSDFKANFIAFLRKEYEAMLAEGNTFQDVQVEVAYKELIDRIEAGEFDPQPAPPKCICGHPSERHEIEMPYPCYECDCRQYAIPLTV